MAKFGENAGDIVITTEELKPENSVKLLDKTQELLAADYPDLAALSNYEVLEDEIKDLKLEEQTFDIEAGSSLFNIIEKNETEKYILTNRSKLIQVNNNDINNLITLEEDFSLLSSEFNFYNMCFIDEDKLCIFYGIQDNTIGFLNCRIYDTLNKTWFTNEIVVIPTSNTRSINILSCDFNFNLNKIILIAKNSNNIIVLSSYITNLVFITELDILQYYINDNENNCSLRLNKYGNNNYYNGKYYFYEYRNNKILAINENTFTLSTVLDFSNENTLTSQFSRQSMIQVTENGVFYCATNFNTSLKEVEFIYSDDEFLTYKLYTSFFNEIDSIQCNINLINDKICFISTTNKLVFNFNIKQNKIKQLYKNYNHSSFNSYIFKEDESLYLYQKNNNISGSVGDIAFMKFDIYEEKNGYIYLPKKPFFYDNKERYNFYIITKNKENNNDNI